MKEDREAEIELLSNMKMFLLDQVQEKEKEKQVNIKDISILKDMLKIEKNMNQKKDIIIKEKDLQLKAQRDEALEMQQEHLITINYLT